jgi:hypothetical protein
MTPQDIAAKIPAHNRKEILQLNMITSAIASTTDPIMQYLGIIWIDYVAPYESLECSLCMERILNNYRQLLPVFVAMEKQTNLLDSI